MRTPDWNDDSRSTRRRAPSSHLTIRCRSCGELVPLSPALDATALLDASRSGGVGESAQLARAVCSCGKVSAVRSKGGDR